jgi:superfamily II DNA or RNA helicase
MAFDAGSRVRRINNPTQVGLARATTMERGRREFQEVDFDGAGPSLCLVETLELCPERVSHMDDFERGRFGGPTDLSAVITLEKLRGELTDLLYSMGAGKTDFYPHQFKPVLKFVQSGVGRILIADEVGLGKTIEAIYLWKELQVRDQARRLLVVCPSMLREKWRHELERCFGIEAGVTDARGLLEALERAERNESSRFALIVGLESCRPPRRFQEAEGVRASLARRLEAAAATDDFGLIDLTIIDEAHYLRNPETLSNRLGGLLRDASRRFALLTATPIQVHADNLFQLLHLIDPDDFPNSYEFEERRRVNEPVVAAGRLLRRAELNRAAAVASIDQTLSSRLFAADAPLKALRDRLAGDDPLTIEDQVGAARMLEERSLLGRHMTRSRKRDVLPDRVQRSAQPLSIRFQPFEKAVYDRMTAVLRAQARDAWTGTLNGAMLGLVTRQRQMASSLPAAIESWRERHLIDEQVWEDFGGQDDEGDLSVPDEAHVEAPLDLDVAELEANDSKYRAFLAAVRAELSRNSGGKIVTFAFFRATLAYLERRLAADGVSAIRLTGGMDDQQERLEAFADAGGPNVLLSSEVASEGVDLQFARVLVNYDLPWNPMRVEQRIGRLDRLGQQADRISIINLFVTDTIEERILQRLYERIGVFETSIGDLEPILGEISEQLLTEVMDPTLTEEERRRKTDQSLAAIAERVAATRELEEEAQHLLGLNDYLLGQIDAKRDAGEWIRPDELRRFINDAFRRRFPASRLEADPIDADYFSLKLCPDARVSLQAFLEHEDPIGQARGVQRERTVFLTNPAKLNARRGGAELIDAGHILLRWLRSALDLEGMAPHAVCAAQSTAEDSGLAPGIYAFAVQARKLSGLRREAALDVCAFRYGEDAAMTGGDAARVRRAAETGRPFMPNPSEVGAVAPLAREAQGVLLDRAVDRLAAFQLENTRLCDQREAAAHAFRNRRVGEIEATIREVTGDAVRARILPVLHDNIRKQDDELAFKLARVEHARRLSDVVRPVALGLLKVAD